VTDHNDDRAPTGSGYSSLTAEEYWTETVALELCLNILSKWYPEVRDAGSANDKVHDLFANRFPS